MKKLVACVAALALSVVVLAGCSASQSSTSSTEGDGGTAVDYSKVEANPSTKTVSIYAEVNGQYFNENTRHGVVFKDGSNGEKSILRGLSSEKDFYQALINIGAVPGDTLSFPAVAGETVQGQKFDVTVSWDGSNGEIPFSDIVRTGNGEPYVMDATFGGNIKNAYKMNTGCILCLDSCPVGIVSSAAYPTGTIEVTKDQQFFGNADVLPDDGTVVKVTFTERSDA